MFFKKLENVALKGLTTAGKVAAGCLVYGATTAASNWHPTGIAGFVWYGGGVALATGAIAAVQRWAQFDPSKVK